MTQEWIDKHNKKSPFELTRKVEAEIKLLNSTIKNSFKKYRKRQASCDHCYPCGTSALVPGCLLTECLVCGYSE